MRSIKLCKNSLIFFYCFVVFCGIDGPVYLSIHLLRDIWMISGLWLPVMELLQASCFGFRVNMIFISLGSIPSSGIVGLYDKKSPNSFPKWLWNCTSRCTSFKCPISLPEVGIIGLLFLLLVMRTFSFEV